MVTAELIGAKSATAVMTVTIARPSNVATTGLISEKNAMVEKTVITA